MTTDHTPDPLALVAAVIDALSTAEAALIGPSDEYEGCAEALAKVRAVLHGADRGAPVNAALAQARAEGRRERVTAKPLMWEDDSIGARARAFAESPFGGYTVTTSFMDGIDYWIAGPFGREKVTGDFEFAKRCCQIKHEHLALSALSDAPAPAVTVADGVAAIAAERQRQIEAEGWTPEHDDAHSSCEMVEAAVAYLMSAAGMAPDYAAGAYWPDDWSGHHWKPTTPRRNLVKAGALVAAEIDRIDRATARALAEGGAGRG